MGANRSRDVRVERLVDKDISNQVLHYQEQAKRDQFHSEELAKLRSQVYDLKDGLCKKEKQLAQKSKELQDEQQKKLALLFCDLPLQLLKDTAGSQSFSELSKSYTMVTLAQCDVVGFATLSCVLKPQEAVALIDHIQAIIDEAFKDRDIFIMERYSDGCIAASGLVDPTSSSTVADTPSYYASVLATGTLKLMSLTRTIKGNQQLQLRVGVHSGPCSAGVISLQTTAGTEHIPHYKLFGPAVNMTKRLCSTGLALQIRVSKQCWELLDKIGGYQFERCPDFMTWNGQKPIESYWLVGHEEHDFPLPSTDQAISLSEYEDIVL